MSPLGAECSGRQKLKGAVCQLATICKVSVCDVNLAMWSSSLLLTNNSDLYVLRVAANFYANQVTTKQISVKNNTNNNGYL